MERFEDVNVLDDHRFAMHAFTIQLEFSLNDRHSRSSSTNTRGGGLGARQKDQCRSSFTTG
jgi:hypothetical protein